MKESNELKRIVKKLSPIQIAKNEEKIGAFQTALLANHSLIDEQSLTDILHLTGITSHDRVLIMIHSIPTFLTYSSHTILFKLALTAFANHYYPQEFPDAYYNLKEIHPDNSARYIYRLAKEIAEAHASEYITISNNQAGGYKLEYPPDLIILHPVRLCQLSPEYAQTIEDLPNNYLRH